ncbi:hypothetical protein GCM10022254_04210 [Actinomadura meridiana]|uniref:ParB-like N-terminal domain-containing protein n=1 Tax=Actinomadura meridiana TaxID=559626 RepID=A0ABP8BT09_9ACTN
MSDLADQETARVYSPDPSADADDSVLSPYWINSHPIARVPVDALVITDSPRLGGENWDHVRLLAELGGGLPPIMVHQPTMRVIDGVHRVQAAILNDAETIEARLLDCDLNVAFVLAVKANVAHGLPLSQPDRMAAAGRIIAAHPQWSDRAVAAATGLSDKTIARLRDRTGQGAAQPAARLGRDGRLRPLDSAAKRRRAAAMISDEPDAGLRAIARATGLSLATVRDVRQRVGRGEDPVPERYRNGPDGPGPSAASLSSSLSSSPAGSAPVPSFGDELRPPTGDETHSAAGRPDPPVPRSDLGAERRTASAQEPQPVIDEPSRRSPGAQRPRHADLPVDRHEVLARLRNDPSLRFSETGRQTLRCLHRYTVDVEGLEGLCRNLPDHCAPVIADLALSCATAWTTLAERLRQRTE